MIDCTLKSLPCATESSQRVSGCQPVAKHSSSADREVARLPRQQTRFGPEQRYELLERIGSGGAGVVHLVYDRKLDRRVAGKLLRAEAQEEELPLRQEARAMARLNHEHIVAVYDYQLVNNRPCLLMEYVEGQTLAALLRTGPLPACQAMQIARDMARGLKHAHQLGVLHLDLKPSNVCVTTAGRAKLMDFGVGSEHPSFIGYLPHSPQEAVIGTPQYMAPEQWSLGELDARTDVWAFGVVLYEMLFGCLPFGNHPSYLIKLQKGQGAAVPMKHAVPSSLARVIQRALRASPDDRFQSACALLTALEVAHRDVCLAQSKDFSTLEGRAAAALHLLGPTYHEQELIELCGLSREQVRDILGRLLTAGVIRALGDRPRFYATLDRTLATACFIALCSEERAQLRRGAQRLAELG